MALGSVLFYRMTSKRECNHGHDAYPHRTCCVSTSQPQDTLNTGMYLDLGKSTVNDISLCKNYWYVCVWGRPRGQGGRGMGQGGYLKLFTSDCSTHIAVGRDVGL